MSIENPVYITGDNLLGYLRQVFPNREAISATEFRDFLNLSQSTIQRMREMGKYPRAISLPGGRRDPRILLVDLAAWIERGGCLEEQNRVCKKRGRGSDTWKKNHAEKQASTNGPLVPLEKMSAAGN